MTFDQILYERPNIGEFEEEVLKLLGKFDSANTFEEQFKLIDKINSRRNHVLTMLTIAEIRAQLDASDKKYQEEQKFINKNWPVYEKVVASYYESLIKSTFKEQISQKYGSQLLNLAEINVNTIGSSVIDKLKSENELISEYTRLMANAKIEFKGEERSLSQLDKFASSPDRMLRKTAIEKKYELLEQYENRIDVLFDSLIQVRTQIAKELGYQSFVELGYARLSRVGFGQQEVADFRKMIFKYMVPISEELREKQQIRIGIENLTYYDEEVRFKTGEANLKGDFNWMIEKFKTIFQQLSDQSGEIFKIMHENKYMDLTIKDNKARGAYATYLCNEKIPYIFANFNGSRRDVKVLAHEFGHAFQMAIFNQNNSIPEYILPTKEACEISSIAMEFLIWPYMEELFGNDAMNYRYSHLEDAIFAMPYRASIDEFQHFIYTNPNLSFVERKKKWIEIEQKYMPYKTTYNHSYLKRGNFWHQQMHLFKFPFYYIDYAMAQICALQIWSIAQIDMNSAWNVYMDICKQGGRLSFLDLLDHSGIASPFKEEAFENMINSIDAWLREND